MQKRKGGIRRGWLEEEVKVIEEGKGTLRGLEQIWGSFHAAPGGSALFTPVPQHQGKRVTRSLLYPLCPHPRCLPVGCKHSCCMSSLVYSVNTPWLTPATRIAPRDTSSCHCAKEPGSWHPVPTPARLLGATFHPGQRLKREEGWAEAWIK